MASVTLVLGGVSLTSGGIAIPAGASIDLGEEAILADIKTGDLSPDQIDDYWTQTRSVRTITVPLQFGPSATAAACLALSQSVIQQVALASRRNKISLVVTPNGSSTTTTFDVIGGSMGLPLDWYADAKFFQQATLTLIALPPGRGVPVASGTSGAATASNVASPTAFNVVTPTGDIPADVTLYIKFGGSANTIRSVIAGCVNQNTTWTCASGAAGWTMDGGSVIAYAGGGGTAAAYGGSVCDISGTFNAGSTTAVAHFTAPTLPSDRRFSVFLKVRDKSSSTGRGHFQYRLRLLSGAAEVIGDWVSISEAADPGSFQVAVMGAWPFPVGGVGSAGTASTTVYLEMMSDIDKAGSQGSAFDLIEFWPEDSTLVVETIDTGKSMGVTGGTIMIESNSAYDTTGAPVGGIIYGNHIRSMGTTRYNVHCSEHYMATLDSTHGGYNMINYSAWASVTPRSIHLL